MRAWGFLEWCLRRCVGLDVGGLGRGGNVSLDCERGWVGGHGDEEDLRGWILYDL